MSNPLEAVNVWGTSAPCVECGIWSLVPGSFGALRGKPHLDEHGRCGDCLQGLVAAELRVHRREAWALSAEAAQRAREPGQAWWRIVSTAVCYVETVGAAAPAPLRTAVHYAAPLMRDEAEWRRAVRAGRDVPPPIYLANYLWDVFDAAVAVVQWGRILPTGLGMDLIALVRGMPEELKKEVK